MMYIRLDKQAKQDKTQHHAAECRPVGQLLVEDQWDKQQPVFYPLAGAHGLEEWFQPGEATWSNHSSLPENRQFGKREIRAIEHLNSGLRYAYEKNPAGFAVGGTWAGGQPFAGTAPGDGRAGAREWGDGAALGSQCAA